MSERLEYLMIERLEYLMRTGVNKVYIYLLRASVLLGGQRNFIYMIYQAGDKRSWP